MRPGRFHVVQSASVLGAALLLAGCAAKYAQLPPRMDLAPYGRVAIAAFTVTPADTATGALATAQFAEALLASQRVELIELSPSDTAWRAAADSADAPAVLIGHLTLTNDRPRGSVSLARLDVRSTVTAGLSVRLVSTETGGTLWRASSERRGTIGRVSVSPAAMPTMSVRDREEAYGELVRALVGDVTRDLRETWVKQ